MISPVARRICLVGVSGLLAACTPVPVAPLPPPAIEDAEAVLQEVVQAGIARDWKRLCATASGTCEAELQGNEDRAPTEAPRVAATEAINGSSTGGVSSAGGVLFLLCGVDGLGKAYESEVFIFDDGSRLLATGAVYWTGTQVGVDLPSFNTGNGAPAQC